MRGLPLRGLPLLRMEFDGADLPLLRSLVEEAGIRVGLVAAVKGAFVQAALEIATDAVEHGGGAGVELRSEDSELHCEVTGRGPGPAAGRTAGIGPRLAEALIAGQGTGAGVGRIRVRPTDRGTLVTLSVPLPAPTTAPPAR